MSIKKRNNTVFTTNSETRIEKQKRNFNRGLHSKSTIIYFLLSLSLLLSHCITCQKSFSGSFFLRITRIFRENCTRHCFVSPGPAKFLPSIIEENLLNFLISFETCSLVEELRWKQVVDIAQEIISRCIWKMKFQWSFNYNFVLHPKG